MIVSENIKVKLQKPVTNAQIEAEFKQRGLDVLRWAITAIDGDVYTIRIAVYQ